MARLPNPGSDNNVWGTVLNDFLLQSHDSQGALKSGSVAAPQLQDNAVTTAKLQDDAVTPAKLATSNGPTDGQVLSFSSGAMAWTTPPATPRIFIQSTDPGANAQDGDIWVDTSA